MNQVQRSFNGLGQLTKEYQSHSGAVNTSSTPKVQYAYTEMSGGANNSRITSLTYADGYVVNYNYSTGLNDTISRLSSVSDSTGTLESYLYLGLATVVLRSHPQPGVDLTYIKQSGESNGDAGDQYTGLDRFGRVVDQRWIKTSSGTATDRFQYGYDRNGNALYRDNLVNSAFGELYAYDNLNQLTSFQRGTLNSTKTGLTGVPSLGESWTFDALGNWTGLVKDGVATSRTANKQNEYTNVAGATPAYDANGNTTTDQTGNQFVYDAWNRLVTVKNSGGTTLESFGYDALGRRVKAVVGCTLFTQVLTEFYYSAAWQVLEERSGGSTTVQYVWSPVYVDAMILHDRSTLGNGTFDERLWGAARRIFCTDQRLIRLQQCRVGRVLRSVFDGLGLQGERFFDESLPDAQSRQMEIGFGKCRCQADRGTKCFGGLGLVVTHAENDSLVVPQNRVIGLGQDGPANDFSRQDEVARIDGGPGFDGKFSTASAIFLFLLFGVHRSSSVRSRSHSR